MKITRNWVEDNCGYISEHKSGIWVKWHDGDEPLAYSRAVILGDYIHTPAFQYMKHDIFFLTFQIISLFNEVEIKNIVKWKNFINICYLSWH